jgi:hypothetical protein
MTKLCGISIAWAQKVIENAPCADDAVRAAYGLARTRRVSYDWADKVAEDFYTTSR